MAFGRGKLIVLGEHSVVHGRPALVVGLPLGAEAQVEPWPRARLEVEPWGVAFDADEVQSANPEDRREQLRQAFAALLAGYGEPRPKLRVRVQMSVAGGAGLGGSAALSVAIVRAIDAQLGLPAREPDEVAQAALAAERVFHGTPSGIDTAIAARSGAILFRREQPVERVALARPLWFVVGDSGEPKQTKRTVASVRQQRERDPARVDAIFDAIESLVLNARTALQIGDLAPVGLYMNRNQELLNGLLLSTTTLETMCRTAIDAGALGAKLTGGGGGGCMIALCAGRELAAPVLDALRALGKKAFLVEVQP